MVGFKSLAMGLCVVAPMTMFGALSSHAEPATAGATSKVAATEDAKPTDADKRAKAADCSKQADEKKLHGEARKKFREACKRK